LENITPSPRTGLATFNALCMLLRGTAASPKGDIIGALGLDGKEMNGTIFVRAAGVLMNTLGLLTLGQAVGSGDRGALGWDDAWKGEDWAGL
jgi:hypothetical protein